MKYDRYTIKKSEKILLLLNYYTISLVKCAFAEFRLKEGTAVNCSSELSKLDDCKNSKTTCRYVDTSGINKSVVYSSSIKYQQTEIKTLDATAAPI